MDVVFAAGDGQEGFQFKPEMSTKPKTDWASQRRRVLLVERHAFMRRAAAAWINRCFDLEVCGMAGGMARAFRAVQQLRPDVVVSEIMRPHDLGFIRELRRRQPRLPILVFSIHDQAVNGARARAAGARGYVMKEAGGDELVQSIRTVLRGRRNGPLGAAKGPMKKAAEIPSLPSAPANSGPVRKANRHFAEALQPPAERG